MMKLIDDTELAEMSRKCHELIAMPMKDIASIPFEDFAEFYHSIRPTLSNWTYAAAEALDMPKPKNVVLRCPSNRAHWAGMVNGKSINYNLRMMFNADLTWLKGAILHELCHFLVWEHTKEFFTVFEQKIKAAGLVDETYNGWVAERVSDKEDPYMFLHPGEIHFHPKKFGCLLKTFFYKDYTYTVPLKIDYKLLGDTERVWY